MSLIGIDREEEKVWEERAKTEREPSRRMIVVDLETLSCQRNALILSIGVTEIYKDLGAKWVVGLSELYPILYTKKADTVRFDVDRDTVRWWLGQEFYARQEALCSEEAIPLELALRKVIDFFHLNSTAEAIWGNSPSFDLDILKYAFETEQYFTPWEYTQERDVRTIVNSVPADFKPIRDLTQFPLHRALQDSRWEATQVACILNKIETLDAEGGD